MTVITTDRIAPHISKALTHRNDMTVSETCSEQQRFIPGPSHYGPVTLKCKSRHRHNILKWLSVHCYLHHTCSTDIRSKDPAFRPFAALLLPKLLTFESLPMPVPNCIARLTLAAALGKPSLLNAALSNSLSPWPGASFKFATSHKGSCKTACM